MIFNFETFGRNSLYIKPNTLKREKKLHFEKRKKHTKYLNSIIYLYFQRYPGFLFIITVSRDSFAK